MGLVHSKGPAIRGLWLGLDVVPQPPISYRSTLVLGIEDGSSSLFPVSPIPLFFGNFTNSRHGLLSDKLIETIDH